MEIYEKSITTEEARNYHHFYYELKALSLIDWIKAYIIALFYFVIIFAVLSFISSEFILLFVFGMNIFIKIGLFILLLLIAAAQRSRSLQLAAMLEKYFMQEIYQEVLSGNVRLKKVKVLRDRIQVFYKRIGDAE